MVTKSISSSLKNIYNFSKALIILVHLTKWNPIRVWDHLELETVWYRTKWPTYTLLNVTIVIFIQIVHKLLIFFKTIFPYTQSSSTQHAAVIKDISTRFTTATYLTCMIHTYVYPTNDFFTQKNWFLTLLVLNNIRGKKFTKKTKLQGSNLFL